MYKKSLADLGKKGPEGVRAPAPYFKANKSPRGREKGSLNNHDGEGCKNIT